MSAVEQLYVLLFVTNPYESGRHVNIQYQTTEREIQRFIKIDQVEVKFYV